MRRVTGATVQIVRAARRIAYAAALAVAIALGACYDIPQPDCGFACGPPAVAGGAGTCPSNYVCSSIDGRCHRISPPFADTCPGDAGVPVDLRPPQLVGQSPAPGSTDVAVIGGFVEVVFDEPVDHIFEFPNFLLETPTGMVQTTFNPAEQRADGWHYSLTTSVGAFVPGTTYTVSLLQGITDLAGNQYLGSQWMFTTEVDTTAPMAFMSEPITLVDVPVSTAVVVSFNEPVVNVGPSTVTLTGPSGQVGASVSMLSNTFATLQPFAVLQPSTQYTLALSTTITDLAGNPLSFTPVTFTTAADAIRPSVAGTNPPLNATSVPVGSNVVVTFTEVVTGISGGTFTLTDAVGGVAAQVSSTGMTATLNPTRQLVPNTTYTYSLSSSIVDLAANPLIPFTGAFTTGADLVPPSILTRLPAQDATGVAVDTKIVADFDEAVTGVDMAAVTLAAGSSVPASVVYDGAPLSRMTLTPATQLTGDTTYTISFAPSVMDTSGNALPTPPVLWRFTTGPDTVIPHVASTLPVDTATAVPASATISATFDEPVTGVDSTSFVVMNAGTGTLAASNGGRTWTFTPDAPLAASTTVTIMLTMGIVDVAGNPLVPITFSFTTAP